MVPSAAWGVVSETAAFCSVLAGCSWISVVVSWDWTEAFVVVMVVAVDSSDGANPGTMAAEVVESAGAAFSVEAGRFSVETTSVPCCWASVVVMVVVVSLLCSVVVGADVTGHCVGGGADVVLVDSVELSASVVVVVVMGAPVVVASSLDSCSACFGLESTTGTRSLLCGMTPSRSVVVKSTTSSEDVVESGMSAFGHCSVCSSSLPLLPPLELMALQANAFA